MRVTAGRGTIALSDSAAALVERIARERPLGLVSFGTPYLLPQVPSVSMYLLAWTANPLTEEAVAGALSGAAITGHLPIDLPPGYRQGWGITKVGR